MANDNDFTETYYAVTLTLLPSYYCKLSYTEQVKLCSEILKAIQDLHPEIRITFFSEPSKRNNCHLHGVAEIKKGVTIRPLSYINKIFRQHPFGFSYIKPIFDYEKWMNYCQKNTLTCLI